MAFTGGESESEKYVCSTCIGDFVLQGEILIGGSERRCSYCDESGAAVAIEQVADRVDDVYGVLVGEVEAMPYFPSDSDRVEYRQSGSTPGDIVSEMLECDEEIANDVVAELSSLHSYRAMKDGDIDRFDDSNDIFEIAIPRSPEVKETWASFCSSIKHDRRFFNDTASELLEEILDPILDPAAPPERSAVYVIAPDSKERFIYRGRMANSESVRNEILRKPVNALGASPRELNSSGRMNSAGIPVFYGSFDVATCVAELRGPVGGTAIVGKFEIIRPLRILDLTKLQNAMFNLSYFDDDVVRKSAYNRFLRGFHREIKKSVIPGSETLDYLPTQFVAEYLWTKADPPINGLIYGSAQISEKGARNIALFPQAADVAGRAEELIMKKAPSPPQEARKVPGAFGIDDVIGEAGEGFGLGDLWKVEEPKEPALRLVHEGIAVVAVKSIKYSLRERSVGIYEMELNYYDPDEDEQDEEDEE
jgi:DNA-directed RNA polymerase subunit RPC12/RpoP